MKVERKRKTTMASSSSSPCAACKFLRRKCQPECVFAPYFPPDQPHKFANVHRIFGASNVSKLLNELQPHQREDAVNSLAYEAQMRLRDPINGCVGVISLLHHQLCQLQTDLFLAKVELSKVQNFGPSCTGQSLATAAAANTVQNFDLMARTGQSFVANATTAAAANSIQNFSLPRTSQSVQNFNLTRTGQSFVAAAAATATANSVQNFGLARAGQSLAATAAAAATVNTVTSATTIHHYMTNMNGGGIGGGGCDNNHLHCHHHRHQIFPRDLVSNFDSGSNYEANLLAKNLSSTGSFGQLNQLLPSAVDDDSHTVHPS